MKCNSSPKGCFAHAVRVGSRESYSRRPGSDATLESTGARLKTFPNVVVIGASDGGSKALLAILEHLPSTFAAPIFAALATDPRRLNRLCSALARGGRLPVQLAQDGEAIRDGQLYLTPPGVQLLLSERSMHLSDAAHRLGYRSVVDPLFASAADVFGERVIAVVLSGASDDGAMGLRAVKREGGIAMVQDPRDASFPRMPLHAIRSAPVDHVLPAAEIGAALALLVHDSRLLRRTA